MAGLKEVLDSRNGRWFLPVVTLAVVEVVAVVVADAVFEAVEEVVEAVDEVVVVVSAMDGIGVGATDSNLHYGLRTDVNAAEVQLMLTDRLLCLCEVSWLSVKNG